MFDAAGGGRPRGTKGTGDWTVLRVPRRGDGDPCGDYRIDGLELGSESVDRADVAPRIVDRLEANDHLGEMPKVGAV